MPTPLQPGEKPAFIKLVQAAPPPGGPAEAQRLESILNNYEDIFTCITRQLESFASNNAYLTQALACFDDTQLQLVGIWNNKTISSPPLSDPVLVVNSTFTDDLILISPQPSPPVNQVLCILGNSAIYGVSLEENANLSELYIGPGVTVNQVDASQPGALINIIWLPFLRSTASSLNSAVFGSHINDFLIDKGSYFGGFTNDNPEAVCDSVVTSMQATEITKNSILVSWTPPRDPYLFINTFYRKTNSDVWIAATEDDGDFVNDTGFIFRFLESDTWYDFRAAVTCNNGGISNTDITTQTVCCGAGTQLLLYKTCPITILISETPDSPPLGQTLCNGVSIDLHYPPGPTITIPYLATVNCAVLLPFVLDNVPYQLMPFNKTTGTWDANGTPIGSFIDGNVITVNVSLPA